VTLLYRVGTLFCSNLLKGVVLQEMAHKENPPLNLYSTVTCIYVLRDRLLTPAVSSTDTWAECYWIFQDFH